MKEKVWEDVKGILQKHFPEMIRIVKHQYPPKTSIAYYSSLSDHLLYISISFLADQNAQKGKYLEQGKELFSVRKRRPASKVLENLLGELENYKATVSTDDLRNLLEYEKTAKFVI